MTGWGAGLRRAAVSVTFETLASGPDSPPEPVTPELPMLARVLAEREISATFFVEAEAAEQRPGALASIALARGETAGLVTGTKPTERVVRALAEAGWPAAGLRLRGGLPEGSVVPHRVRYLSVPSDEIPSGAIVTSGGVLLVPFDRTLSDAAFLAPTLIGKAEMRSGGTQGLHEALQIAIGTALERREHLTLTFFPGLIDRADTLAVLLETLDLVRGLERAGRLWVPTLGELADWWPS